jgi:hypothetical protein
MPAILAAALSRGLFASRGSEAGGFAGGRTNKGEGSCDSLCRFRLRSGSGSEDMFRRFVAAVASLLSPALVLSRWNRSIALYNSPEGLISASDA